MLGKFESARFKINRAKTHLNELRALVNSFGKTKFYDLSAKEDPENGEKWLEARVIHSIERDAATIIGDTIHNLRSTLDLMACEIVDLVGMPINK